MDIADGPRSGLDADTVDGMQANALIAAAQDEVRTPIDIVPVTISTPGSYYLTGNLTVASAGVTGIAVAADDVTIDLMGFSLIGPGRGAGGLGTGIAMIGRHNVTIKNGTVREFAFIGIYETDANNGQGHRVVNVRAMNNFHGIYLKGRGHLIKDCTAGGNANFGLYAEEGSTVIGNTAYNNEDDGISAGNGVMVTHNAAYGNWGNGIDPADNNLVMGNTAYLNISGNIDVTGCPSCTLLFNHAP